MQKTENLLYSWEVVANLCPYLSISDLVSTATLSKEWNYMLKKYIESQILPSQMQKGDALRQLKALHNRKLCIYDEQNGVKQFNLPYLVMKVSVGALVTVLTLCDNRHIILMTSQLRNGKMNQINLERKFSEIYCSGQFIYCVDGTTLTRMKITQQYKFVDQVSKKFPQNIDQVKFSAYNVLVFTSNNHRITNVWTFNHKSFKEVQLKLQGHINPEDFILSNDVVYYIRNETVYKIDLNNPNEAALPLKSLKGKIIVRILSGSGHYIALARDKKLLSDWSNSDVIQWCMEEGFDDYVKVFKNQKITGKKLLTMDKSYMEDVLGITSAKVQSKMAVRIEANNVQHTENYTIYVWGRNQIGQLGVSGQGIINNPIKPKTIPDDVDVWNADGNYTFLQHRKNGEILINKLKQGATVWEPLTRRKIWLISAFKRDLVFIASEQEKKIPQALSEEPLSRKKQKLRTAKNIIDQIQWDEKYNQKEFRVGYLDKFTGELECSFEQLLVSEVKEYRIMYFKRGSEVVWDKAKRIDNL